MAVPINSYWTGIHGLTGNLFLVLMGVHLAMHWRWILNAVKRYIWPSPKQKPAAAGTGGD